MHVGALSRHIQNELVACPSGPTVMHTVLGAPPSVVDRGLAVAMGAGSTAVGHARNSNTIG